MIYFSGSESLKEKLPGFNFTRDLSQSRCAVLEMPGNRDVLERMNGDIPVYVVITGMLNFAELRAARKPFVKVVPAVDELISELTELTSSEANEDDMMLDFNSDDIALNFDDEDEPDSGAVQGKGEKPPAPARQPAAIKPAINPPSSMNNMNRQIVKLPAAKAAHPPRNSEQKQKPEQPAIPMSRGSNIFQRSSRKAPIVVSYSAEGGAGKTFMATNIGGCVALTGVQTVLVDLDLAYGDCDTALGLTDPEERSRITDKNAKGPKRDWVTISDWRRHAANLKPNILQHNSGLYVIPAYPYAGQDLSESEVEELLYLLSDIFSFVVVDIGVDAFSPQSRTVIRMADTIMLVGGQSEKTIGKVNHFLKQEGGHNKARLVFNKVTPMGMYDPDVLANKFGFDTYHEVPEDHAGVNAAKKQHKLAVQLPGCQAGDAVKRYAAAVLPIKVDAPPDTPVRTRKSFMTKLFGKLKIGRG